MSGKHNKTAVVAVICAAVVLLAAAGGLFILRPYYYKNFYVAPVPSNLSNAGSTQNESVYGDYYVSPAGDDSNDGSRERPFKTFEAAQKAVRALDKKLLGHVVVSVMAGTYETDGLRFTSDDSGNETCAVIYSAYGDGEVIISGGASYSERMEQTSASLVDIDGAQFLTISNFTVGNFAGNGISARGANLDISLCTVRNVSGTGISVNGTSINIGSCFISHTGGSGIEISGGKLETLSPGNCAADNNLVFNTGERDGSQPAVRVEGVGNMVSNNEIFNTPSTAVFYAGNGNKIEYNFIHNAVLLTSDSAAIASPMRWDYYGNFVRYNCISTLGDGKHKPCGIFACSGTQVTDNILVNVPRVGIDLMGGRDITVSNNIIINSSTPINYVSSALNQNDEVWQQLKSSPYQSAVWRESFPDCSRLLDDEAFANDPMYAANPANSRIENNVILQAGKSLGTVSEKAQKYSRVGNNAIFGLTDKSVFADSAGGVYTLSDNSSAKRFVTEFYNLPFESMGRY